MSNATPTSVPISVEKDGVSPEKTIRFPSVHERLAALSILKDWMWAHPRDLSDDLIDTCLKILQTAPLKEWKEFLGTGFGLFLFLFL